MPPSVSDTSSLLSGDTLVASSSRLPANPFRERAPSSGRPSLMTALKRTFTYSGPSKRMSNTSPPTHAGMFSTPEESRSSSPSRFGAAARDRAALPTFEEIALGLHTSRARQRHPQPHPQHLRGDPHSSLDPHHRHHAHHHPQHPHIQRPAHRRSASTSQRVPHAEQALGVFRHASYRTPQRAYDQPMRPSTSAYPPAPVVDAPLRAKKPRPSSMPPPKRSSLKRASLDTSPPPGFALPAAPLPPSDPSISTSSTSTGTSTYTSLKIRMANLLLLRSGGTVRSNASSNSSVTTLSDERDLGRRSLKKAVRFDETSLVSSVSN
ncbi:hypothetical protein PUNSTDRAFT_143093 [Punctularia strigosozonata HHB-11173 SS5]|uniref:uncharacterized protein n=1 Tax=Punctularia strigosozonata (strain HHB-11173) TaxID=741275 RepID=UPI0004418169|nr:uncharacterized protein PUNSTDRAFT_143093 [Punctularia strigosozonata HHB-11173 SS5]EIN09572.1 hypothetical protein PUNSTDRAFT_143093 [Punctularia strigosozonata HHB-11173 SS5]